MSNRWRGERWFDHDRLLKMRNLADGKGGSGIQDGKVSPLITALQFDIPWAFTGVFDSCGYLSQYWDSFRVIPKKCRESCWKVCVKLQTVHELYQFHLLQGQMHILEGFCGKCGIDLRWYTSSRYAGFWYNKSQEDGQYAYERTVELMRSSPYFATMFDYEEKTGKEVITLKKGCTEMQVPQIGGYPSSTWEDHPKLEEWKEMESRLDDMFSQADTDGTGPQPAWMIDKTIYSWCEFAHQIGDPTYLDVLGHDPFAYVEDTYHKKGGDIEVDDQSVENPPKTRPKAKPKKKAAPKQKE